MRSATRFVAPALALLLPAAAAAFVMSAGQVLRRAAQHREDLELKALAVRGTFTFRGPDADAAAAALKIASASEITSLGTVTYKMPGRCKVELDSRGGLAPAVSNVNGTLKTTGPALAPLSSFAARVCPLLAEPTPEALSSFLRARGVDTTQATLGRVNGAVAYVIGGKPRDTSIPTFWVEKDRYNPLRLVAKEGGALEDIKLLDYSSPLAGEWHPRVVELRRGEGFTRFVADQIETNPRVPENLF